jgi:hypothetical protein
MRVHSDFREISGGERMSNTRKKRNGNHFERIGANAMEGLENPE